MSSKPRYMLTSALPYANGPIHLGHLAGAYLPGDIFARFCRQMGRDVLYICGSDEHGVAIMMRARQEGRSPQEIVDQYHERIKSSFQRFGMSFDHYGRTSSEIHHKTSADFFLTLLEKNAFKAKTNEQLYDPEAGMFLADRFVRGTCPNCGYEDAYGDQCENCGTSLSPSELINPRSAVTNATPVMKETTHWYLPLGDIQPGLEKWIQSHPEWRNNVTGQIGSWFKSGLSDRAMTRDLDWGIPLPSEVAAKTGLDVKGKVLYVWFDAPIGYISISKEWAEQSGNPDAWKPYWQDSDSRLIHFIGKDNIVFHCLIFPALLMAHGDYVLPYNVPSNEFLNLEGHKLSTSRNYAVWLEDYLEKFEPDSLRYVLTATMPESKDSDFSWKDFQARHNNELADILGNFVNRTFTFIGKYYDNRLPERGGLDDLDQQVAAEIEAARSGIAEALDRFQFKEAAKRLMNLARFSNKYFNDQEPWKSRKENPEKCATTLNLCAHLVHSLAVLMGPFLPFTAAKLWKLLQLEGTADTASWTSVGIDSMATGHTFGVAEILFRKIEDETIAAESEKLRKTQEEMLSSAEADSQTVEPKIDIGAFHKIDLRAAKILSAEAIPKAKKLLRLTVDTGQQKRQIVAGLAEFYQPEELVGKTVAVVANLEEATIRGVVSQGMLLAADNNGRLVILSPESDVAAGSKIT